jgi:hypothetical protein
MSSFPTLSHFETLHPGGGMVATALVAGALLSTEFIAPRLRKRETDTSLIEISSSTVLAFGGLKHASANFMRPYMEPTLGAIGSVRYPRQGLDLTVIGRAMGDHFSGLPAQSSCAIAGQSLGFKTFLGALRRTIELGGTVPQLDTIWGVSSPKDSADITNSKPYRFLPAIASRVGGVVFQVAGDALTEVFPAENRRAAFRRAVYRACYEQAEMQNPRQWATQLGLAYHRDEHDIDFLARHGAIGEHTTCKLAYFEDDPVINSHQASERLASDLSATGANVEIVMLKGMQHAELANLPETFWQRENRCIVQNK